MDDFDREIARIHRRRMVPSLIFSSDTAVVLIIVLLIWFLA
jgi:hypothetical protein